MVNIAICDDQVDELEHTHSLVQKYQSLHPELNISLHKFVSGLALLESIRTLNPFDIYLLDILMPELNGINLGTTIRETDNNAYIVYLTSSPDFALQSYKVDAGGYLLKPFSEKDLFPTLDKVVTKLDAEEQKRFILRISRDCIESIPYSHLICLEYYQHRLTAYTTDGQKLESIYYRQPFRELAASITDDRFVKVGASVIVNMQHIRNISSREILLSNEKKFVISRQYSTSVRQSFMNYLLERGNNV